MIIRFLQLLAFAVICAPLFHSVATFDEVAALRSTGVLSKRATDFIREQRETGTSMWNEVSMATPPPTTAVLGTQQYRTPCFSISIPWPHTLEHLPVQDDCILKAKLIPSGRLAIQAKPSQGPLLEQTAVLTRLQRPEQFVPTQAPATGWPETLQFIESDTSTIFLASEEWTVSIAATGIPNPNAVSFTELVSTLEMQE